MRISEIDQETLDINWFFTDGTHIGFVASGGGKLPESVSSSKEDTHFVADYFFAANVISDFIIDTDLKNSVPCFDNRYLADFCAMAQKGLFAFDRTVLNDFSALDYHLVVSPLTPLKLQDLPDSITSVILNTKSTGLIGKSINLSQLQKL